MLLRGLIRPQAYWPFGLFRPPPAHVQHAVQRPLACLGKLDRTGADPAGDPAEAYSYYCGCFSFAGETVSASPENLFSLTLASAEWRRERDGLSWLRHFRASPRRLHIFYLARLLDGWMAASSSSRAIASETARLNNLAGALSGLAARAGEREQAVFRHSLNMQCARVMQIKAREPREAFLQSVSLIGLARRNGAFRHLRDEAWAQLAACLPHIVMADGSDPAGEVDLAVATANALAGLIAGEEPGSLPGAVMSACDRLFAYLAMFRFGPGPWSAAICADVSTELEARLESIHPASHAPQGGRTLLRQAETRILAHWGRNFDQAFLEISQRGQVLFLVHAGEGAPRGAPQGARHEGGMAEGELLSMSWAGPEAAGQEAGCGRSIYLSADGKDIRFEDSGAGEMRAPDIRIDLPSKCRILRTQDHGGANIYMADGSGWQLRVRGAWISAADSGGSLRIACHDGAEGCVQWALKKHPSARSRGGKPQRRTERESELPF